MLRFKRGAGEEINKLSRPSLFCHACFQDKGWKPGWEAGFIKSSAIRLLSVFRPDMWEAVAQWHQLQSSHNDTNYWLVNGQLSLEDSARNTIVENRGAQDQSLPPWTCCKTRDASKGHLSHIAVSLSLFLIHTGPWRLILGDSYTCPTHTFSLPHKPPSEPLSIHLHSRLVDKPRITMWSRLLKAHRHLFCIIILQFRTVLPHLCGSSWY